MERLVLFGMFVGMTAVSIAVLSRAAIVDPETFDSGASLGTASAYFGDNGQNHGLSVKQEIISGGPGISNDVGSGYLLLNGTCDSGPVPARQIAFDISRSFAASQNTTDMISFYIANDNSMTPPRSPRRSTA